MLNMVLNAFNRRCNDFVDVNYNKKEFMQLFPPNHLLFFFTCLIFVSDLWGQYRMELEIKNKSDSVLKHYFKDTSWMNFYEFVGSYIVLRIGPDFNGDEEGADETDTLNFKICVKERNVLYALKLRSDSLELVDIDNDLLLQLKFDENFQCLNPEALDKIPECLFDAEVKGLLSFNQLKTLLKRYRFPNWGSGWRYAIVNDFANSKLLWQVQTRFTWEASKKLIHYTMFLNALTGAYEGVREVVLKPD